MALAGIVIIGSMMGSSQAWSVWTSSASSLSCGMGVSRSGRSQSSQKQLSALMACPMSLPFRKKRAIKMKNGCPVTSLLMAENHKSLLGYV